MITDVLMHKKGIVSLLFLGSFLSGCAAQDPVRLGSAEHLTAIENDKLSLYPALEPAAGNSVSLTLPDAMNRALTHNLDVRVAALEALIAKDNVSLTQFEGAPNITASGTYTGRNNLAASSSESILTGTQSLEPSTSSERERLLGDIKAQWNILDGVIAYLDGKNAEDQESVSKERLRKVQHNIERDVVNAYWQAYAGQEAEKTITALSADVANLEQSIKQALGEKMIPIADGGDRVTRLLQNQRQLNDLYQVATLSESELKAISAIPTDMDVTLLSDPQKIENNLRKIINNKSVDSFINLALENRPEVRESFLNANVSARAVERELLSTLPGLNLIYSRNYDDNRFLNKSAWTDFSTTLTQSLTDFISLPTRYNAAKNRKVLEAERRKALTAAVIAQVHIAQIRMNLAEVNYNLAKSDYEIAKKQTYAITAHQKMGAASGYDSVLAKTSIMAKEMQYHQAFAEMQKSYVDMIGTLGLSVADLTLDKGGVS